MSEGDRNRAVVCEHDSLLSCPMAYLDYFSAMLEDRLWRVLAKPVFQWRNRSDLSMNAARADDRCRRVSENNIVVSIFCNWVSNCRKAAVNQIPAANYDHLGLSHPKQEVVPIDIVPDHISKQHAGSQTQNCTVPIRVRWKFL